MEVVDAGSRQSTQLPSISYLESEKMKREEMDYPRTHSVAAMVNPYPYPGPPPPYSHPQPHPSPANLGAKIPPGLLSPPESRRTSGETQEQKQQLRQSLPSIHEALGTDQSLDFPPQPLPPTSNGTHYYQAPSVATSPTSTVSRALNSEAQAPPPIHSYPQAPPESPFNRQQPPPPPSTIQPPPMAHSQVDANRPSFSVQQNRFPSLHPLRTAQSPVASPARPVTYQSYPQQSASGFDQPVQSASAMNHSFGYTTNPAPYTFSAPAPPSSSAGYSPAAASYPTSNRYGMQWRDGPEFDRTEESRRMGRVPGPAYGESVKRHLENFDFEASLNEISESSGQVLDFAHRHGQRAHQTQRSGPVPGSLPSLPEVDDLIIKAQRMHESFIRIRDVVVSQQAALAEEAQEQHFKGLNGFNAEDPNGYQDDSKGGFAGSDPKKRRGRAAPPGRCHSCNRAETPEWRRGPDGARTLCNACGLHYAKLTRKMGTNKAAVSSSNLRPKSMGPGSPI